MIITRRPTPDRIQKIYEQMYSGKHYIFPYLAPGVALASAVIAWTMGAFVQIVPSGAITSKFYITGIYVTNPAANIEYAIDLAFGGAGAEVVYGTVAVKTNGANNGIDCLFSVPIAVPVGTRVSARCAVNVVGVQTCNVKLRYKS